MVTEIPGLFFRYIEKMVPILTFTSIFEEPSSGSIMKMYLPAFSSGTMTGSSISSEVIAHTVPDFSTMLAKVEFANSSNFWTSSPCTLIFPVTPSMSPPIPALLTSNEIILAATRISFIKVVNSPVAPRSFC